jgi:hypothetical protein
MEDIKEVHALQHINAGVKTVQVRLERVLLRETIESIEDGKAIDSPGYDIQLGNESTSWKLRLKKKDNVLQMFLIRINVLNGENKKIKWVSSIKNPVGKLIMSRDFTERKVSEYQRGTGWGTTEYCEVDELEDHYVNNKITVVCDLTFTIEKEQYIRNSTDIKGKYDTEESERQFVKNMKALYGLNSFSDLVIYCGDQKFLCHKNVLAARSDIFKEMLISEEKKINGELEITETDPDVFKHLIDHIYSGKIPNDIDNVVNELYKLAIKYNLQILAKACEISLLDQITVANALDTLVIIDNNKFATSAKNDVIKYITINGKEIIDTEKFKTFSKEHSELMIEIVRCLLNQQSKEVLSTMMTEESD